MISTRGFSENLGAMCIILSGLVGCAFNRGRGPVSVEDTAAVTAQAADHLRTRGWQRFADSAGELPHRSSATPRPVLPHPESPDRPSLGLFEPQLPAALGAVLPPGRPPR